MRPDRPLNRRGLTLMELVVSMGVATLAVGLGLQLYAKTQQAIDRQQLQAGRLGRETDLLSLLRRDIRLAATVDPRSTDSRLILVAGDGSRVEYRANSEGVTREGAAAETPGLATIEGLRPRFAYPSVAGRGGRVVEVSWGDGAARRSVALHLRNGGTL
ncbi:MAG: hypothetical protein FJX74_04805 [Armatimonadetes bacterium]|nr:hypothetical protein [Armatimonadota bacterium]